MLVLGVASVIARPDASFYAVLALTGLTGVIGFIGLPGLRTFN